MVYHNASDSRYHRGRNTNGCTDVDRRSQSDNNIAFIMDSLRVIRNQLAVLRIYLPLIFTFCVLTLFVTIFINHMRSPSSVFIFNNYAKEVDSSASGGETGNWQTGPPHRPLHRTANDGDGSLAENFNGFLSYSELMSKGDYFANRKTCEYGSLWQTSAYLQGNDTIPAAKDEDTRTLDLMNIPALPYLPNYRSPCFLQNLPDQQTRLRCLPYFFLAGFPKCGTTDMYKRMEMHPLIAGANQKEPLWFSRDRVYYKKLGKKTSFTKYITEFSRAIDATQSKARRVTLNDDQGQPLSSLGYHPLLIGDFSTRVLFNERLEWKEDRPMNAHVIRHVMPCTKFIVLMRDPVERLYSDYIYFLKEAPKYISPQHFHSRVVESINWWKDCTAQFPVAKCLFGSPKEMPPVHTDLCFNCWQATKICPNIRIGLYYYILQEWLKLFPLESFLFLRMEDYTGHELDVLNNQVFPFLGIPPLGDKTGSIVEKMKIQFPAKNEDVREKLQVSPMLNATRSLLTEFYREANIKLANLLKDKGYLWNS